MVASSLCKVKVISSLSLPYTIGSRAPWICRLSMLVPRFSIINVMVSSTTSSSPNGNLLICILMMFNFSHFGVSPHWLTSASHFWRCSQSLLDIEFLLKLLLLFCFGCYIHVVIVPSLRPRSAASSITTSALVFNMFRLFRLLLLLFWLLFWSLLFWNRFVLSLFLRRFRGLIANVCSIKRDFG